MRQIYLDYNATTPVAPLVQEALRPFLAEHFGDPAGDYPLGRACHEAIEDAREQVASLLGAERDEIVFTSGGTESNNLALKGVLLRGGPAGGGHLVTTTQEHPAILQPARFLEQWGCEVTYVGCDRWGLVDPDEIKAALRGDTQLVSVIHANHEIGTIQPLRAIAEVCHARGVLLHTDAAQTCGKIRTQVDELGVDLLSLAGHKLYAPKGIGALYVRRGTAIDPILHGAGQEAGLRAGTENTAFIVGLGRAAWLAACGLDAAAERLAMLRDRLAGHLREGIGERFSQNGALQAQLPNTLSVNFPEVTATELLRRIPELCASAGSDAPSGAGGRSSVLKAIELPETTARGTVRFSLGAYTSEEDIDRAASLLIGGWQDLR